MNYQTTMSDEKLIQFYLCGDPNAMATLVELYKDRIYQYIYNMVKDNHEAEEIFKDTFICIINNMIAGKTSEDGNFLKWANGIAQNICIEFSRRDKAVINNGSLDAPVPVFEPYPVSVANYHQSHNKIKSLIDLLPDEQKEVMLLNHYAGLSFNEIAETKKYSVTRALDCMKFGLNNLRKMMAEKEVILN